MPTKTRRARRAAMNAALPARVRLDAADVAERRRRIATLSEQTIGTPSPEPEPESDADGEEDGDDGEEAEQPAPEATFSVAELADLVATRINGFRSGHPMARFNGLAAYAHEVERAAGRQGPGNQNFAIVNQITTDNPGVVPPGWIAEILGIIDNGRPAITALGTRALPPSGMDINWPYFDGDLSLLVAAQASEKAEIASVKVSFKKGTKAIGTYAGGSDISYQLLLRSDPSYLEAYLRVMYASYGLVTDKAFVAALVAGAGASVVLPAAPTAAQLQAALFEGSAKVQTATGSPASAVIVAPDVFVKFGSLAGLYPPQYGTQNVLGTASASTLDVNVSGLRVVLDPNAAAGTVIITNGQAASWFEAGPFTASMEDVTHLGRDVAVWGMGAAAIFVPLGVVKTTLT
jgi:hypothetical protein